jgi:hypothetical protein
MCVPDKRFNRSSVAAWNSCCWSYAIAAPVAAPRGGEADAVFLVPDLSAAGDAAYRRDGTSKDAVIRLFYVGLTRARESVYICAPESAKAVRI